MSRKSASCPNASNHNCSPCPVCRHVLHEFEGDSQSCAVCGTIRDYDISDGRRSDHGIVVGGGLWVQRKVIDEDEGTVDARDNLMERVHPNVFACA